MRLNRHAYKMGSAAEGKPRYGWRIERQRGRVLLPLRIFGRVLSLVLWRNVTLYSAGGMAEFDRGRKCDSFWGGSPRIRIRESNTIIGERNRAAFRKLHGLEG